MPFVLLIVGALLIVSALNNAHGDLGKALQSDLPGFFKWGAAIAAILGLGFVPGLKTASRWLLALVLLVIVLKNYSAIFAGFTSFAKVGPGATNAGPDVPTPTDAFAASAGQALTPASPFDVSGGGAGTTSSSSATSSPASSSSGLAGAIHSITDFLSGNVTATAETVAQAFGG